MGPRDTKRGPGDTETWARRHVTWPRRHGDTGPGDETSAPETQTRLGDVVRFIGTLAEMVKFVVIYMFEM